MSINGFRSTPNPDTPPDSWDPTGVCPRCGRTSNFRSLASLPVTFDPHIAAVGRTVHEIRWSSSR